MIGTITEDLHELVVTGRLFEMKGIGKGLGSALSQAILRGSGQKIGFVCMKIHHKG